MKRNRLMTLSALAVVLLVTAYSKPPKANHAPTCAAQPKPKAKVLVERLPVSIEGVTLDKEQGVLRLKSGYELVKKDSKKFEVAQKKASGGRGVTVFSGSCKCADIVSPGGGTTSGGSCSVKISGNTLSCDASECNTSCALEVTVGGATTSLIRY